jgi:hypothetical protein
VSKPGKEEEIFLFSETVQVGSDPLSFLFNGYLGLYREYSGRDMKLTTALHSVPSGAVLLVPLCAFMAWTMVKFYTRDIPTALIVNNAL